MQVLSEDAESLADTLKELGITLKPVMYKMDVRPLLRAVCDQFFGTSKGFVDMVVEWVPSAEEGARTKVGSICSVLTRWSSLKEKLNFGFVVDMT